MRNVRPSSKFLCVAIAFAAAGILTARAGDASTRPANQLSAAERTLGWQLLFDGKTTAGWHTFKKKSFPDHGWEAKDGWLHCLGKGGGDVISDATFDDFDLEWDWKQARVGNSGLKYFVLETRPNAIGHEYQMIDDEHEPDAHLADGKRGTAAFYDVLKPTVKPPTKPPGETNHSRIVVQGNHVEHWLNGTLVLEYECGSEAVKAAVAKSKFKNFAGFGDKVVAHLLLQDHHSEVWFQNLKLREIKAK